MPVQTLHVLTDGILLKRLPRGWDNALCQVLGDQLGVTDTITADRSAEGYRIGATVMRSMVEPQRSQRTSSGGVLTW